jgi:thymidylate synthase
MFQYLALMAEILEKGSYRKDRTGTGTLSIFGHHLRFSLFDGFPLITTRQMFFRGVVCELIWSLSGDTNTKFLKDNNVNIWQYWEDENGDLGPIYGKQWRAWKSYDNKIIDQISAVISSIKSDPYSRRHIVSAWNVSDLPQMVIPPCPVLFQFYVQDSFLSCSVYQRSADVFIGLPFDIAAYALLLKMVAQVCHLEAKELVFMLGDAHLYIPHIEYAQLQLMRAPLSLPNVELNQSITDIFNFSLHDVKLINYTSHSRIKAPIAI